MSEQSRHRGNYTDPSSDGAEIDTHTTIPAVGALGDARVEAAPSPRRLILVRESAMATPKPKSEQTARAGDREMRAKGGDAKELKKGTEKHQMGIVIEIERNSGISIGVGLIESLVEHRGLFPNSARGPNIFLQGRKEYFEASRSRPRHGSAYFDPDAARSSVGISLSCALLAAPSNHEGRRDAPALRVATGKSISPPGFRQTRRKRYTPGQYSS